MSRSRPQEVTESKTAFGSGFPVGRSVCGCYLKKISVVEKYHVDDMYHQVRLMFLHENSQKWITKFISDKPPSAFETEEKYLEHKTNVAKSLENLMACYLSGDHIKHIMFQSGVSGIVSLMDNIQTALSSKNFWATEVCLKTVPNDDGGVSFARFTPYMNFPDNSRWTLTYSKWELEKISKFKNKNK